MENLYEKLVKHIEENRVLKNEEMSKHTSLKIGGIADIFIYVNTIQELKKVIEIAKQNKVPITCIGNGSNLLVKDNGIRGITIKLNLKEIEIKENIIKAGAGVSLPVLAKKACENNLSGLEFASGIPGTIGGAIKMNAGAYGGEFKDIVINTTYLDENLNLHTISNEEQKFSYRKSRFSDTDDIIISTMLKLQKGNMEKIKLKMEENLNSRKTKQPINIPNAGSVFKRKNEYIPAQIIDKCGLKGYNIGDAYVSDLHAGFIVNKGKATAKDFLDLVEYIKKTVYDAYGINLELEIKIVGE